MAKHHGESDDGFSEAVAKALKDVKGSGNFNVDLKVTLSPNPGKITYQVTLTSP